MQLIAHRVNTAAELSALPAEYGAEIDLRELGDKIILQHEPFTQGEDFASFIKGYRHSTLILNVKAERIEWQVLELLKEQGISDYFFLDSSFPMINLLAEKGEKNTALRYSEYEKLDTIISMAGRSSWVWVDCFTRLPLTKSDWLKMKEAGFKVCLVSPDLLGRGEEIPAYISQLKADGIELDAVCAKLKNFDQWRKY